MLQQIARASMLVVVLNGMISLGAGAQDWSPARLAEQAQKAGEISDAPAVIDWLARADELPEVEPITLHIGPRTEGGFDRTVLDDEAFASLDDVEREGLRSMTFSSDRYYATFYGTPIAYAPAMQIIAEAREELSLDSFEGARVLDFGYGQLGQLEMLARCGASVVGVEIDPIVHSLYEERGASRAIETTDGRSGEVELHLGDWFADDAFRAQVAADGGFDIILARNVLKKGYVTPEQPMPGYDPVDVGGSPEKAAQILYDALSPGGVALVYNLGGGSWWRDDGSYHNPADIRDPFGREAWDAAGFEILAFDAEGSDTMRRVGVAVGWGATVEDLAAYNVLYTLVRKPE